MPQFVITPSGRRVIDEPIALPRWHRVGDQVAVAPSAAPPVAPSGTRWILAAKDAQQSTFELIKQASGADFDGFADALDAVLDGAPGAYGIPRAQVIALLEQLPASGADKRDALTLLYQASVRQGVAFDRYASRLVNLTLMHELGIAGE
jgi:hypothetical protein